MSEASDPNDRILMAWLLERILIYRDEADYREIFACTSFGPEALTVEYEPLRANMFVVVQRRQTVSTSRKPPSGNQETEHCSP
jgi:hypothetical protein